MKKLLFAALVAVLMLAGCSSNKTDATATPEATATPKPTETAKATATPEPTATASAEATTYKDGVYEGEAEGYKGPIVVTVEIVGGKIESVDVYSQNETAEVAANALVDVPAAIVKNQSTDVDVSTGATFTSKGIIEAVNNALTAAKS